MLIAVVLFIVLFIIIPSGVHIGSYLAHTSQHMKIRLRVGSMFSAGYSIQRIRERNDRKRMAGVEENLNLTSFDVIDPIVIFCQ